MLMGNKELTCVDKLGRALAGGIQVVRSCIIPGRSIATVHCIVDGGYFSGLGVVESTHNRIWPADSLNRLMEQGEIWLYTGPIPSCPRGGQRFVVGKHSGESSTAPTCTAEGHPIPRWDA